MRKAVKEEMGWRTGRRNQPYKLDVCAALDGQLIACEGSGAAAHQYTSNATQVAPVPRDNGARQNKTNKAKELRCPHADADSARQL